MKRFLLKTHVIICAVAGIGVIALSLFAAAGLPIDWGKMGDIGQAVAAVTGAFGLVAVAVGTFQQTRAMQIQNSHAVAETTRGLLRLGMEDPQVYAPLYGGEVVGMTPEQLKLFLAFRMTMYDLRHGFLVGVIDAKVLNDGPLPNLFQRSEAREYWAKTREEWLGNTPTKACKEFAEVVDKAYYRAVSDLGVPNDWRPTPRTDRTRVVRGTPPTRRTNGPVPVRSIRTRVSLSRAGERALGRSALRRSGSTPTTR